MSDDNSPQGIAAQGAAVAEGAPTRLTLQECLDRVAKHKQAAALSTLLRAQRVTRLLSWGQPKGSKSTTLLAAMKWMRGDAHVWSLDWDIAPWDRVIPVLLPLPCDRGEMVLLSQALLTAGAEAKIGLLNGTVSLVMLDTITKLYSHLSMVDGMSATDLGFGVTQSAAMQAVAPQARVCMNVAAYLYNLHGAAVHSPLDSPIVLAVTEHASIVTNSKARHNPADPKCPFKMDFRFHHWAPQIGAQTGNAIFGMADVGLAFSMNHASETPDYRATLSGPMCGNRFTTDEAAIFTRLMGGTDRDRLGKALRAIWEMRKLTWAKQWKLL